jgi:MerR family transcriptional regulator, light-induced transcriptional regulator
MDPADQPLLRIGELSRRLGVSDHVLRAWESRYGLLRPVRSAGGFRLYAESDERRVRRMQAHLDRGLSAAEAARAALAETQAALSVPVPTGGGITDLADDMRAALDAFDEPLAQALLDRLLTDFTVEAALRDVVMPYLRDLGDRWERGDVSVAQEHFASNVLRGRLSGMARGWGLGNGPQAVLAAPPGELHDLGLMVFGIILHATGWRIRYLGTSTPVDDLARVVDDARPALVVLAAVSPERFEAVSSGLARLAQQAPLALAGAGASPELARTVGASTMRQDPVTCARELPLPPSRA